MIPILGLFSFNLSLYLIEKGNSPSLIKSSVNLGAHIAKPLIIPNTPIAIIIFTTPNNTRPTFGIKLSM